MLHHVDLDAGYRIEDAPLAFVLAELADSARRFTDQAPLVLDAGEAGHWHYGPEPGPGVDPVTVTGTPQALFGWVTGRGSGSGLTSSTGTIPDLPPWG